MTKYRVCYMGVTLPRSYASATEAHLALLALTPDDPESRIVPVDDADPYEVKWIPPFHAIAIARERESS